MTSNELRESFLRFFKERGHKELSSSSLIPENDPSVLFTTAGMQQFKKYYSNPELAEKELGSKNIVTIQKCIRTRDIEEVGDNTHLTFFEMMGNFSFGGYGKKEAIQYAHDFIVKELGLKISYVTIYKGNEKKNILKDEESEKIWKEINLDIEVREEGEDVFWGPTGDSGPCGPTTEIYCENSSGEDVEIWNVVFNEYFCDGSREKLDKGQATLKKLPSLGIDTGMGFERLLTIVNNKYSVYETDLFLGEGNRAKKIISDHIKASMFLISEGVLPSNTGAGYVLRRLIRRAYRFSKNYPIEIIQNVKNIYKGVYNLDDRGIIAEEMKKFSQTLAEGLKEFEKGQDPFVLFSSYGFPIELTLELAKEKGIEIDMDDFNKKMEEHQKLSRTASAGMFKGGLANENERTVRLHTAQHLLLASLKKVLGEDVKQRGSNITEERLRLDFTFDRKLTDEEKQKVEDLVNKKINEGLNVVRREIPIAEAKNIGAEMEFGAKYPEIVSVYFVEDKKGNVFSKEFCGGPHVSNTSELGHFKIKKEEASSRGVRRIKAILDK